MIRVAVTGGMGFIGQELLRQRRDDFRYICVDYYAELLASYEKARLPCLQRVYGSLSRCDEVIDPRVFLDEMVRLSPHVIVHLGAVVDTTDMGGSDSMLWTENFDYTRRLCMEASRIGAHLVFASSASVYGRSPFYGIPANPYALTKVLGEKIVNSMKTRTSCLRFFNVFGRYEHHKGHMASLPFKLAQAYRTRGRFDMHSPDAERDFVPVSEVAGVINHEIERLMGPMEDGEAHSTFDVGSGRATSLRDLDAYLQGIFKAPASAVNEVPMPAYLEGRYQGFTRADANRNRRAWNVDTLKGLEQEFSPGRIDV